MYKIQKVQLLSSSRIALDRYTSLGLGITILQVSWDIYNTVQQQNEESLVFSKAVDLNRISLDCNPEERDENAGIRNHAKSLCIKENSLIAQLDIRRWLFIGVILYARIILCLLDAYLYTVLRSILNKDKICNCCWLGLYLQISLLTYNTVEILIVAYNGVFDGSSILLAASATVRAISIEMICSFLREIEDKQETDAFLYFILTV